MYDELTEIDIQKMREEIRYRVQELRPKLIEDVQTARAFGDLSENFEYKCASVKPSEVAKPYTTDSSNVNCFCITSMATPNTAQLVVIRGRNTPNAS